MSWAGGGGRRIPDGADREKAARIPRPRSHAEAEEFVRQLLRLPLFQRAEETFRLAEEGGDTWSRHRRRDGSWKSDRAALHRRIVQELLNPAAKAAAGEPLHAVFVLGLPGTGKTTTVLPLVRRCFRVEFTVLNPDEVKERLPEYRPEEAPLVHRESSHVAKGPLLEAALEAEHNLLFDEVGGDAAKMLVRVRALKRMGYRVHLVLALVPTHVSVRRVVERFLATRRYVPPGLILDGMEARVRATYEQVKASGEVHSFMLLDADVEPDAPPVEVERHGV